MRDSVFYLDLTPTAFRRRLAEAPIAYLPLGTLEWHGEHLPLGADALQPSGFFERLARRRGGIVLPPLFVGPDLVNTIRGQVLIGMDFYAAPEGGEAQREGSAYWVPDDLFVSLVGFILQQLRRAGFRIVVAHGHGPSTKYVRDHAGEWERGLGLRVLTCLRDDAEEKDGLGLQTDHAAANETSITMALRPDLVHMEYLSPDPAVKPVGVAGLDPRAHASRAHGRRILRAQEERLAAILAAALGELA